MEKFIGDIKKLEVFLANNLHPATRFVRHAPTQALTYKRKQLPGEQFLASRRPDEIHRAKAYLQVRRQRASIGYQARRKFSGTVKVKRKW